MDLERARIIAYRPTRYDTYDLLPALDTLLQSGYSGIRRDSQRASYIQETILRRRTAR